MTRTSTADRLADGYPHGTPAGYRDGCRGNGGCPNRDSDRMTCKEASLRYASDPHYRRAYDAGDIWLNREEHRDAEQERVRNTLVRRARGDSTPQPEAAPDDKQPEALLLEEAGRKLHATVAAIENRIRDDEDHAPRVPAASEPTTKIPPRATASSYQRSQARVTQLEQQLAAATAGEQRAAELARMAAQEAETAKGERDAALAEAERLREQMTSTLAATRRYVPGHRAAVEVYTLGDQLHISLNALLDPASVVVLAEGLGAQRAS